VILDVTIEIVLFALPIAKVYSLFVTIPEFSHTHYGLFLVCIVVIGATPTVKSKVQFLTAKLEPEGV